jgi:glutamine amidotransferase
VRIAIIDYGIGNLASLSKSLERLKVKPLLVNQPRDLKLVDSIIFPGVGNFTECIKILKNNGWVDEIKEQVIEKKKSILGICLGMQLLASYGLEGALNETKNKTKGLGLIPGSVVNLKNSGCHFNIPHVGWNEVEFENNHEDMFFEIPNKTDFYFVHSFIFLPDNKKHVIAKTNYGISFTAAVRNNHIWGTQFHPEKSSYAGLKLIENFIDSSRC